MNDLPLMKNCPHCGGNPFIKFDDNCAWSWVECYHCGAAGPKAVVANYNRNESNIKAIEGWNRRFREGSS